MVIERTKGKFLFKTPCDKCGSSKALHVYQHDDAVNGYCYKCKTNFFNIDPTTMEPIQQERYMSSSGGKKDIAWVLENSKIAAIPDRNISEKVAKDYGVRVGISPSTGEIDRHFYPIHGDKGVIGYKVREVETKDFWVVGSSANCKLFGQERCGTGGRMLIVTEGELDAMAATEMINKKGKKYRVVSLPFGANAKAIGENLEWMCSFDNIFLSLDMDEPGLAAEKDASLILPTGKVRILRYSEKDPSDMLKEGKYLEYFNALFDSQEYRPDGIVSVEDVFEEAITPVVRGLSWPWPTLTDATFGYRREEIYGFGAGSGCGKTEGFKEIIDHVINVHDLPAGIIFLEEPVSKTLKVLAGKRANKRFHIPDSGWEKDELISEINHLRGKVYLYNHFGAKDWDNIKAKIRYMVVTLGIKDIFLDHLTALVAQEADEYRALNRIMEEMASLVQELDFTLFYISHLRKASGVSHEEGGQVSADQFKGSGAIVFWSNFLFGYERNQQADDKEERNTTLFRVLKDRNTGLATGLTFQLYYDHSTGRWEETVASQLGEEEDVL